MLAYVLLAMIENITIAFLAIQKTNYYNNRSVGLNSEKELIAI